MLRQRDHLPCASLLSNWLKITIKTLAKYFLQLITSKWPKFMLRTKKKKNDRKLHLHKTESLSKSESFCHRKMKFTFSTENVQRNNSHEISPESNVFHLKMFVKSRDYSQQCMCIHPIRVQHVCPLLRSAENELYSVFFSFQWIRNRAKLPTFGLTSNCTHLISRSIKNVEREKKKKQCRAHVASNVLFFWESLWMSSVCLSVCEWVSECVEWWAYGNGRIDASPTCVRFKWVCARFCERSQHNQPFSMGTHAS